LCNLWRAEDRDSLPVAASDSEIIVTRTRHDCFGRLAQAICYADERNDDARRVPGFAVGDRFDTVTQFHMRRVGRVTRESAYEFIRLRVRYQPRSGTIDTNLAAQRWRDGQSQWANCHSRRDELEVLPDYHRLLLDAQLHVRLVPERRACLGEAKRNLIE